MVHSLSNQVSPSTTCSKIGIKFSVDQRLKNQKTELIKHYHNILTEGYHCRHPMYDTVSSSVNPALIATVVTIKVIMKPMLNDYCMLWLFLDVLATCGYCNRMAKGLYVTRY